MGTIRIVLEGHPYAEPRYYAELHWNERNVYIRHPHGGKDSRHQDGTTYLTSTGRTRLVETRVPTSSVGRELVNFVDLPSCLPEPPVLRGAVRTDDLILPTTSAGTAPRIAVEIVSKERLPGVLDAWQSCSPAANLGTHVYKGLDQYLVVAIAGSNTTAPST